MSDVAEVRTDPETNSPATVQDLLQHAVDSLSVGVVLVDHQGRFLHINPASEHITGIPPSNPPPEEWSRFVGVYKPDGTLWPVDELPLVRAMRGEEVEETDLYIKNDARPEGVWIRVSVSPLHNQTGALIGAACIFHDVTAQKRSQERLVRQRELLRDLLQQQEHERSMVSHEIHDGFLQKMVGANMMLQGLASQLTNLQPQERATLEAADRFLSEAATEACQLVAELRPMVIESQTLAEAMEELVHGWAYVRDLQISLDYQVGAISLSPFAKGCVFRIVQETLTNVVKHSESDTASLRLRQDDGMLSVEIEDQGRGFRLDDVAPDRFGLRGIRERARLLGGEADISTRPGKGTRIVVKLPIQA